MMVRSHRYCYFICLFFLILQTLASSRLHHCRHDQRDTLLEFKDEFPILRPHPNADHTSLTSWNKSSDCCSWEGVTCDTKSGKVISLDLDRISLNNSLKPNSGLFKLQNLQNLSLSGCDLYGEIPSSLGNLSLLTNLLLQANELGGQLPASIVNLTQLTYLDLSQNKFSGMLPPLFTITSLKYVLLGRNQFEGPIEFGNTSSSSSLYYLRLDDNQFDGPIPDSTCGFLNLGVLYLRYNDFIGKIPRCISKLSRLIDLDVSSNYLEGEVPAWLWRLTAVRLSHNSFSSFEKSWEVINVSTPYETRMWVLYLNSNSFRGPFPKWICKFSSRLILLLDLSNNSFSGSIPLCLKNFIRHLQALILNDNNFSGILPEIFLNATRLRVLDVGSNQLEGKLPKSLINCKSLEFLNVESNGIKDKFPYWLPWLSVLILRSNKFHGSLLYHNESIGFQSLIKVIDISHNDFTGALPSFYFHNWPMNLSEDVGVDVLPYMELPIDPFNSYSNSMEMVHKGTYTKYDRIRRDFRAIDFSGNKFYGNIPESIGLLKELRLLNLSGNAFTSNIPQSLANLTKLEELDLSRNQLSGQIPQALGSLSFLSSMDFSHNNLQGPIPRGTQFQSQNCSSFTGNPKLSGLEEICGKTRVPKLAPQETEELSEPEENWINWIAGGIAYGPGVFCGLVIGHIFVSYKHEWLMEKFGRSKQRVVTIRAR